MTYPRNHPVVKHGIFDHPLFVLFALLGFLFDIKEISRLL